MDLRGFILTMLCAVSVQLSTPVPSYTHGVTHTRTLLRETREWVTRAACGFHPTLPWTGDPTPTPAERQAMSDVCGDCPVMTSCAVYALTPAVVGGFYAGVWLPWPTGSRRETQERSRARRILLRERRRSELASH